MSRNSEDGGILLHAGLHQIKAAAPAFPATYLRGRNVRAQPLPAPRARPVARNRGKIRTRGLLLTTVVVLFVAAPAASAQNAAHRGDPRQGRSLAVHKCDACHIVASGQQITPLVAHYAPSFYDVANKPGTTAESLEAFLAKPHAFEVMPYPDLTAAQVADLVSYILSLRGRH